MDPQPTHQQEDNKVLYLSPLNGSLYKMTLTLLGVFPIVFLSYFLYQFISFPELQYKSISQTLLLAFTYLSQIGILLPLITASYLITITIFKKNSIVLRYFVTVFILVSAYFLYLMLELGGFNIKFFINLGLILAGIATFGFLSRIILRIKFKLLKYISIISPILIILIILSFTAVHAQNSTYKDCMNTTNPHKQALCYNFVAKKTNNLDLCMEMNEYGNSSLSGFYYDRDKDCIPTVVNKLKSEGKFTSESCSLFSNVKSRDFCFNETAVIQGESSLCSKLSKIDQQEQCLEKIIPKIPTACSQKIETAAYTTSKSKSIIPIPEGVFIDTKPLPEAVIQCIIEMAISNHDFSLCKITGNKSGSCFTDVAVGTGNPDYCVLAFQMYNSIERIDSSSVLGQCYYQIAVNKKIPSICENIKTYTTQYDLKTECYKKAR